jgi:hypothetical protein
VKYKFTNNRGIGKESFIDKSKHPIIKRVAFVGNYLPRQCGIATFTTDLCEAVADEYKGTACNALPVNDTETGYEYPSRVRFELTEKDIESYHRAADFLNINNVDMVSLQHEYGIFGGRAVISSKFCAHCACPLSQPCIRS